VQLVLLVQLNSETGRNDLAIAAEIGAAGLVWPLGLQPFLVSAGLSLIEAKGAREKCSASGKMIHTACTGFPQAEFYKKRVRVRNFLRKYHENSGAGTILSTNK
jgi:hypothetical protein